MGYLPIKHAWVDSSLAPLYQVIFPARTSDEKLVSYCRAIESWSAHVSYPVGWLMDLSRVEAVSAQQRAIFAKYMKGMDAFDRRCNRGSALVLPSALMRGVTTAIFWLYSPSFMHRTFAEPREGLVWLREVLSAAGVEHLPGASDGMRIRPSDAGSVPPSGMAVSLPARGLENAAPRETLRASAPNGASSVPPREPGSARPNQR